MRYLLASMLCLSSALVTAQTGTYDSALAKQWKADDYGMRQYVLVLLKTGAAPTGDKHYQDSLFRGHMNNIIRLASEGKLAVAGPLGHNDHQYEGIFVFSTSSMEEAKSWVNTDPAVQAGALVAEYIPWYCTASLMGIRDAHAKVQKKSF